MQNSLHNSHGQLQLPQVWGWKDKEDKDGFNAEMDRGREAEGHNSI